MVLKIPLKFISHLVAVSNNNVIGKNNDLPWKLKRDLQHFKNYTTGKTIVMGRKTYESIGRPLPNRRNIIISSTIKGIDGAEVFSSLEAMFDSKFSACRPFNNRSPSSAREKAADSVVNRARSENPRA